LSPSDRLTGALDYVIARGGEGLYLSLAVAASLRFCPEGDPASAEVARAAAEKGVAAALEQYAGITGTDTAARITRLYEMLGTQPLDSILSVLQAGIT